MMDASTMTSLIERFLQVRSFTETLCAPLETEDYVIQSMPDVSPAKWHLAHTSWFFETFVLASDEAYRPYHPQFGYLFNSYYNAVGPQWTRAQRGVLSRPTVSEIFKYRRHVDEHMSRCLADLSASDADDLAALAVLGLHHEQQHQELMLMDIKHVFGCNPLRPVYRERRGKSATDPPPMEWLFREGGMFRVGHEGEAFAYDNERPSHDALVRPFHIGSRLVTCGEYTEFIEDGGYRRPELWLSDGWSRVCSERWEAPLYWDNSQGGRHIMTLSGFRPVDPGEPVCHVSYFEADAYASWVGARLATEQEWESVACGQPVEGNFIEQQRFHPAPATEADSSGAPLQMFGDAWEWTSSPYTAYPGYRAPAGAVGEYNGKFMCNQFVLRGGSCVTSRAHIRRTYRNFFPPHSRWPFTGVRLARDG